MSTFVSASAFRATFAGRNGAGSISLTGAEVGDVVVSNIRGTSDLELSICEHIISVADEIQQLSSGDFSGDTFTAILVR